MTFWSLLFSFFQIFLAIQYSQARERFRLVRAQYKIPKSDLIVLFVSFFLMILIPLLDVSLLVFIAIICFDH